MILIKSKGKCYTFNENNTVVYTNNFAEPAIIRVTEPNYKDPDFSKKQVMLDAAIRSAIPFGNTVGVITGGKSGRGYHAKNWVGGAIGKTAGALLGGALGSIGGNEAAIYGSGLGAYLGTIGGSVAAAAYQKNIADENNKILADRAKKSKTKQIIIQE